MENKQRKIRKDKGQKAKLSRTQLGLNAFIKLLAEEEGLKNQAHVGDLREVVRIINDKLNGGLYNLINLLYAPVPTKPRKLGEEGQQEALMTSEGLSEEDLHDTNTCVEAREALTNNVPDLSNEAQVNNDASLNEE